MTVRKQPSNLRAALAFALGFFLPNGARRAIYRFLLGYVFAKNTMIGRSFVRAGMLEMDRGSRIGHFTVIRNVDLVKLGEDARIGTFNWIYGFPAGPSKHFAEETDRVSEFIMEEQSSLTSRHIVDCTNRVTIGAFSTVAGFYSQILSHGIDFKTSRQTSQPVTIGRFCMIGTGSIIVKGAVVPNGTVLVAGSTFRGKPTSTHSIFAGIPAEPVRELRKDAAYFKRISGPVD